MVELTNSRIDQLSTVKAGVLFYLLCLLPEFCSRVLTIQTLTNEIIYPRMALAGIGADLAVASLTFIIFLMLSLFIKNRSVFSWLFIGIQVVRMFLSYANLQYSVVNLQLIPFKNIVNYGGDALQDQLFLRGLLSELFKLDFIVVVLLPLIITVLLKRFWMGWLTMKLSGKGMWLLGVICLMVIGNGMKWSFDVVRFIGSPIVSHFVYYWIEEPFDKDVINRDPPQDISLIRDLFKQAEPTFGKPDLPYQPNIIVLTIESFRASENSIYGGKPGITPNFHDLAGRGTLFTSIFHNGCCTPSGILAVLCAQQPQIEHITVNQTYMPAVCMSDYFQAKGYETAWVNAMGAGSDRFGAFQRFHKVERIVDGFQFPEDAESLGWAYADEELIKMADKTVRQLKTPFYLHVQTQTSHSPFFVPEGFSKKIHPNDPYNQLLNSLRYADKHALGFVKTLLDSEVGKRTIFVITADHGIFFPAPWADKKHDPELAYGQIPLLMIFPKEFSYLPKRIQTLGSQIDIFPTLLDALGDHYPDVTSGYSLFAKRGTPRFAYVTTDSREVLITESLIWKLKPGTQLSTWTRKPVNKQDPRFLYWQERLPQLSNFNYWLISTKNREEKDKVLQTLFH